MRKTIVYRILFFYVVILFVSLITTAFLYSSAAQKFMNKQASYILDRDQNILMEFLRENTNHQAGDFRVEIDAEYQLILKEKIERRIIYITSQFSILNKYRRTLFSSADERRTDNLFYDNLLPAAREFMDERVVNNFIKEYRNTTYNVRIIPITKRISTDLGGSWLILYTPSAPTDDLIADMNRAISVSFIVSIVLLFLTGIMFARMLTAPIIKLKTSAERISSREFDTRVEIRSKDELGMLAEAINKMAKSLKEYDEAQKRFLQNASHELKTPLMSIQGYAEGIKDNIFENKEEALNVIISESTRLEKLVGDLLLLSKLETLEDFYTFKKVDIDKIIKRAIERVKGVALHEKKELNVKNINQCKLICDENKMIQALLNILGNAIRYSKSTITLNTKVLNNQYKIYISDDGRGIKDMDIENIFVRFYKGRKGLTGLGLSITKIIIDRHDGSITAYNNKIGGATFEITLPIKTN